MELSLTPDQHAIRDAALRLDAALSDLVPDTTIHYGVVDARKALQRLVDTVGGIVTNDVKAEREAVK